LELEGKILEILAKKYLKKVQKHGAWKPK